jgi:hypothetical protein
MKKPKKKTIIIAVVVILLLLIALAGGEEDGDNQTVSTVSAEFEPAATEAPEESREEETAFSDFGEQLSLIDNGEGVCVLKYKINSQLTDKLTIEQNYYTVCNFVTSGQADGFQEIQYWAIADTQDGDETKVISFTVNADTIEAIKNGNVLPTTLEDSLEDLWILPSLDSGEEADTDAEPDSMTTSQKNALSSAKAYLNYSAFSYSGLISQLEYEQYSTEDATFAADNCGADWNEQALRSAGEYLNYSAFSYSGLISQLEYEGFTSDQATYGADNCGADWFEQAAKSAEEYLAYSSFSRDGLISQLEFEGFTNNQAVYGVEQNGF